MVNRVSYCLFKIGGQKNGLVILVASREGKRNKSVVLINVVHQKKKKRNKKERENLKRKNKDIRIQVEFFKT